MLISSVVYSNAQLAGVVSVLGVVVLLRLGRVVHIVISSQVRSGAGCWVTAPRPSLLRMLDKAWGEEKTLDFRWHIRELHSPRPAEVSP